MKQLTLLKQTDAQHLIDEAKSKANHPCADATDY